MRLAASSSWLAGVPPSTFILRPRATPIDKVADLIYGLRRLTRPAGLSTPSRVPGSAGRERPGGTREILSAINLSGPFLMSDQKRWFKLWHSALTDDELMALDPATRWAWAAIGAHTKVHGTKGHVEISLSNRALAGSMGVNLQDMETCIRSLPHMRVEEVKKRHGWITVTWNNWIKFQEDSTQAERARSSRSKRRGEEKRGEQEEILPPAPSREGTTAACPDCVAILAELNRLKGSHYRAAGKERAMMHARHEEHGLDACIQVVRHRHATAVTDDDLFFFRPSTLFRPTNFENDLEAARAGLARREPVSVARREHLAESRVGKGESWEEGT